MAQQLICICCVCGYFCLGVVLFWHIFALAYFCLSVFLYFSGANLSLYLTRCHADWNRVIWPSCSFVAARAELQWLRLFWHPANSQCSTHCVHSWCTKCIVLYPFSTLRIPIDDSRFLAISLYRAQLWIHSLFVSEMKYPWTPCYHQYFYPTVGPHFS